MRQHTSTPEASISRVQVRERDYSRSLEPHVGDFIRFNAAADGEVVWGICVSRPSMSIYFEEDGKEAGVTCLWLDSIKVKGKCGFKLNHTKEWMPVSTMHEWGRLLKLNEDGSMFIECDEDEIMMSNDDTVLSVMFKYLFELTFFLTF